MRLLLVLAPLLCSGCYTVRFYDGALKDAGAERGRAYDLWVHSFFWGMLPAGKVDTSMCRDGVRNAKSQIGGLRQRPHRRRARRAVGLAQHRQPRHRRDGPADGAAVRGG